MSITFDYDNMNLGYDIFSLQEELFFQFAKRSTTTRKQYMELVVLTRELGVYLIEEKGSYLVCSIYGLKKRPVTVTRFEDFFKVLRWGVIFQQMYGISNVPYRWVCQILGERLEGVQIDDWTHRDLITVTYNGKVLFSDKYWDKVYGFLEDKTDEQIFMLAFGLAALIRAKDGYVTGQAKKLLAEIPLSYLYCYDNYVACNGEEFRLGRVWTVKEVRELIAASRKF